jgi:hypothetical protein
MESFPEVAKYAGQIGLVLFVLFALVKGLLGLKIFTLLTQGQSFHLLNKLVNVVLTISVFAIGAGLIEKCNKPELPHPVTVVQTPRLDSVIDKFIGPFNYQSNGQDGSKYNIIFDEVMVRYRALHLPSGARNYQVCFKATAGTKTINKQFTEKLGIHIPEWDQPSPFSLRGIKLEGAKNSDVCKITIGFDSQMGKACSENAKEYFEMEVSDFARQSFANSVLNNYDVEVKYHVVKQEQ